MSGPAAAEQARHDAFSDLFRAHARQVQQQVRLWVPASDVDEVLSSTFATAWAKFAADTIEHPRAWLLAIAWGHCRNARRARRRSEALIQAIAADRRSRTPPPGAHGHDAVDPGGSPSFELEPLLRALGRLAPDDQDILTLSAWQQLRPEEIAEVLGLAPGTVRSRLSRARRRLEREIARLDPSALAARVSTPADGPTDRRGARS